MFNLKVQAPKAFAAVRAPVRAQRASIIARAEVNKDEVLNTVRDVIAEQLGLKVDEVSTDKSLTDLGADSLDTVEVMMALEEKFEITFEDENAEQISTVGDAVKLITAQLESA